MEPTHEAPAPGKGRPDLAELVVRNGRQRGARRPLTKPLTLIGRGAACDVRLNVDGVSDLHCALVQVGSQFQVRALQNDFVTQINGQTVAEGGLTDGDELTVGPFRFKVRLPAPRAGETPLEREKEALRLEMETALSREREALRAQAAAFAAQQATLVEEQARVQQRWLHLDQHHEGARAQLQQEREGLRIQAAALVAQQVALTEVEARLRERCTAFEQQEAQISAHLDERQRQLLQLQEQTRQARTELQADRAAHETQVADAARDLSAARRDLADNQRQVQEERRRLADLMQRLKRRWHRHWTAERANLRVEETELAGHQRDLEKAGEEIEHGKAALTQAWLRFNADVEIGRRQLQAAWQEYRDEKRRAHAQRIREQAELRQRQRDVARFEADLRAAEGALNEQRQHWHASRAGLEKEAQGLDCRVRNQRRRLHEQEQEVTRLEGVLHQLKTQTNPEAAPAAPAPAAAEPTRALVVVPQVDAEQRRQLATLEKLADELADQRTQLTEHCQRLAQVEDHWQRQHEEAAAELEVVGRQLAQREQALETGEVRLRQLQLEAVHVRQHLEGWQSRLAAREAAWEGERQRLLTDLQMREQLAQKRLQAVAELHDKWAKRRRLEVDRLQADRTTVGQVREECAALREEWLRRHASLEREHRTVAERALALEQYRQEIARKAPQPALAEKRLHRLRRRAVAVSAATARALARERQAILSEACRLEAGCRQLDRKAEEVTQGQAELTMRLQIFEKERLLAADQTEELHQRLANLVALRDHYDHERGQLRDEVERLSRLLIEEEEKPASLQVRAA